jgi:hypothetical protein
MNTWYYMKVMLIKSEEICVTEEHFQEAIKSEFL